MAKIDLSKYGITGTTEVVYNPSYEVLFEEETKAELEGFEKGQESELGAVNVMTGIYTGRSPKDKFIVMDENSKDTVWWTSGVMHTLLRTCSSSQQKQSLRTSNQTSLFIMHLKQKLKTIKNLV